MLRSSGIVAALLAISIVSASCVDVLGVDGYAGATNQLCTTIEECFGADFYPDCRAHGASRLTTASEADRATWLKMFAGSSCLDTCAAARSCLDASPLCGAVGQTCGQTEQCCGFTTGAGECEAGGACCRPNGIACTSGDECCLGDCTAPSGESQTFCGGFQCNAAGAPCTEGYECCTGICLAGRCSEQTCLPVGSPCTFNAECCDGQCDNGEVVGPDPQGEEATPTGTCVATDCRFDGEPCEGPADCCNDHFCVEGLTGVMVCSANLCLPAGTACVPGENECCSGTCNDQGFCTGCGRPGAPCDAEGDCCDGNCDRSAGECVCYSDGIPCEEHTDCCTSNCVDGFCGEADCPPAYKECVPGEDTCCASSDQIEACQQDERTGNGDFQCCDFADCSHTVCAEGGPLLPECGCTICQNQGDPNGDRCIDNICDQYPHCCCFEWDSECTLAASEICGVACPASGVGVQP
jgi:hypothetical protein